MTFEARLILKRTTRTERWEFQERGDYNLDRFDQEFRDQLYSDRGREILRDQPENPVAPKEKVGC